MLFIEQLDELQTNSAEAESVQCAIAPAASKRDRLEEDTGSDRESGN